MPDGFRYASDTNEHWLTTEELLAITDTVTPARRAADRGDGWEIYPTLANLHAGVAHGNPGLGQRLLRALGAVLGEVEDVGRRDR